jgi:hypothetical protein
LGGGSEDKLNKFTRKIFKDLDLEYKNLEVKLVENPKEVTCNGCLNASKIGELRSLSEENIGKASMIYNCIKEEGKEFEPVKYSECRNSSEIIKEKLVEFHKFFFKLNEDAEFTFSKFWQINKNVTKYVQDNYEHLLDKCILNSIIQNQPTDDENRPVDHPISETPFFTPLKSIILVLSEQIATGKF